MGPGSIDTRDEEAYAVRTSAVVLRVSLCARGDLADDAIERDRACESETGRKGLLLHVVGEDTGIGGEAGKRDAIVRVDGNDLLLVG